MGKKKTKEEEYEEYEEEHEMLDTKEYGKPKQYDPNFKGPIHNRSCTDIICCILFLVFIVGMIIVSIFGYARGDPYRLIYPTDSNGKICGMGDLKDKPYLFFFDLLVCAKMGPRVVIGGCPTPQVCVKSCPTSKFFYGEILVREKVTNQLDVKSRAQMICKHGVNASDGPVGNIYDLVQKDDCAAYYVDSKSVVSRCIPAIFGEITDVAKSIVTENGTEITNALGEKITGTSLENGTRFLAEFYKVKEYGELVFKDLAASWYFVLIGLAMAMGISLLWIILMRWIVGIIVWLTLIAFVGLFAFGTYYSFRKYFDIKDGNVTAEYGLPTSFAAEFNYILSLEKTWLAFAITSSILLAIFLLILLFLAHRICIAIQLLKEGSKAIGYMMFTLMWPLIPFLLQFLVVIYWGSSAVYIASMGKAEYRANKSSPASSDGLSVITDSIPCTPGSDDAAGKVCSFIKYGGNEYTIFMQVYMLFMFFWLMNFVVALGQMTLAGAFASYYWAWKKPKDIPSTPLASSLYRAIRYHLGTLAFGSLIIAIIQIIRTGLEYLDRKMKGSENQVARFFVKCLKCCFWCLEKILKFINKNAYIMTAVYGKNFCTAAKDAFFLIMRNIVRTFVLDKVADFIMFISKLMVTGAVGVAGYFWFQGSIPFFDNYRPSLNFYLTPVIILVVGAYLIASSFFNVYNMAVDTLFMCFLEDLERHDGSPEKPFYMSKGLMKILRKSNKKPK